MNTLSTTIYFKYGSMNSGKSLELIKVAYNYAENNIQSLVLKPGIDSRKPGKVFSRVGLELEAHEIPIDDVEFVTELMEKEFGNYKVILIEECNFLTKEVIDTIINFAYLNNVYSAMFFGLKVDFRGELFPGTKRVIERADKIEEATSVCWCGKKARQNGRVLNGALTKEGPTVVIEDGSNTVEYITLCNYHFHKGMIK
ncbi:MAG: thymidine kinase [Spiroplasma sp.]|nr:thymidine kinase [Mycoplasmatales bacterium]